MKHTQRFAHAIALLAVLVLAAGCPHYEICVEAGLCPDVAIGPSTSLPEPPKKPAEKPAEQEQHNHCATKVTCFGDWNPDHLCCFECGARCP